MKKFVKILSIIISFLIGSNVVLATNARFLSGGTHVLADKYKMQLLIENPGSDGNFTIVYDTNDFSYTSNTISGSSNQYNITSSGNQVSIDVTYAGGSSSDLITLWFNEKKTTPFTTTFTINATANNQTNSSTVDVSFRYPSSNANLSALTVKEGTTALTLSPSFSSNVTSYYLTTYASSIKVSATKEDSKAKVSGTGTKNLSVGSNTVTVSVTAEDGTPKDYVIHVTRLEKSSDNSLKELSVNGNKLTISSGEDNYSTTIDTQNATVSALAKDSGANVSYPSGQSVSLSPGESKSITVKVTAENGSVKNYTVTISRKNNTTTNNNQNITNTNNTTNTNNSTTANPPTTSNSNTTVNNTTKNDPAKDSNNYIKSLKITNVDFSFNKKTLNYMFNVDYEIDYVDFDIKLESSKSSFVLTGNNELTVGKNSFKITVTAENGSKREYMIVIDRSEKVLKALNEEQSILDSINGDLIYDEVFININDINEKTVLTPEILTALKANNKELIISYMDGSILECQLHIKPEDIIDTEEIEIGVKPNYLTGKVKNSLSYKDYYSYKITASSNSIKQITLDIYLLNKVADVSNFDTLLVQNDETTSIIDNKQIEDGYLSYTFTDYNEGIIVSNPVETKQEQASTKKQESKNNTPIIIGVGVVIAIGAGLAVYSIKNKKVTIPAATSATPIVAPTQVINQPVSTPPQQTPLESQPNSGAEQTQSSVNNNPTQ